MFLSFGLPFGRVSNTPRLWRFFFHPSMRPDPGTRVLCFLTTITPERDTRDRHLANRPPRRCMLLSPVREIEFFPRG